MEPHHYKDLLVKQMTYQVSKSGEGSSDSFGKLKSLYIPDLKGKAFLDLGCNEGFFCGYAISQGASRVVGLDLSIEALDIARISYPEAHYLLQGWDEDLPEGKFDVILISSALHYANDPEQLIRRCVDSLTLDGVLILEVGHVEEPTETFISVTRPVGDTVRHPALFTLMGLARRNGFVIRYIGQSVSQSGDLVPRVVWQFGKAKRTAFLLANPSTYGKSSIANTLLNVDNCYSLDQYVYDFVLDLRHEDSSWTSRASITDLAITYELFENEPEVLESFFDFLWPSLNTDGDITIEGALGSNGIKKLKQRLKKIGFLTICLDWEHAIAMRSEDEYLQSINDFMISAGFCGQVAQDLISLDTESTP